LITPERVAHRVGRRHRYRNPLEATGRWALLRAAPADGDRFTHVEHLAQVLLQRYGVVFRALLEREQGLPAWRDLLYVYRRLEARGELRGGRFVQGFAGEQFALPEAVGALRQARERNGRGELVVVSAVDPLNLAALATPGQKSRLQGRHLLYRDGVAIAVGQQEGVTLLRELDARQAWQAREKLTQARMPANWHKPPGRPV
ncbi:MAG TPA: ATP-dependent DNA helicase, partial [Gammaproteobacteria bacterium]